VSTGCGYSISAILFALMASFSSMQGLFTWIAGSVSSLFFGKKIFRAKIYWFWNITGIGAFFAYVHNAPSVYVSGYWGQVREMASNDVSGLLLNAIVYFFKLTGASLFGEGGIASIFGFYVCCFSLIVTVSLFAKSRRETTSIYPYSLVLYGFLCLAAITAGRFLLNVPLSSRYSTFSITIILGLLLILYNDRGKLCKTLFYFLISVIVLSLPASYIDSIEFALAQKPTNKYREFVMLTYESQPTRTIQEALPFFPIEANKSWLTFLKEKNGNVFRGYDEHNKILKDETLLENSGQIALAVDINTAFFQNQEVEGDPFVRFESWAVDQSSSGLAKEVFVTINGVDYAAYYGIDRPDVAKHFSNKRYRYSGFKRDIPAKLLPEGLSDVDFKVIGANSEAYLIKSPIALLKTGDSVTTLDKSKLP
jgi:hypothetical protein